MGQQGYLKIAIWKIKSSEAGKGSLGKKKNGGVWGGGRDKKFNCCYML